MQNTKFSQINVTSDSFDSIADKLLNKTIILINKRRYRICEIEFYLYSDDHPDDYVHCDSDQQTHCCWYFHKFGNGTYKGGTFKGLDITFGNRNQHQNKYQNKYCGILIRSIQHIKQNRFIEGPCNVVNEILKSYHVDSISDLTLSQTLSVLHNSRRLILQHSSFLNPESMYHGPRIGLSSKYPEYQNKPYRYVIHKDHIKKQRKSLVLVV